MASANYYANVIMNAAAGTLAVGSATASQGAVLTFTPDIASTTPITFTATGASTSTALGTVGALLTNLDPNFTAPVNPTQGCGAQPTAYGVLVNATNLAWFYVTTDAATPQPNNLFLFGGVSPVTATPAFAGMFMSTDPGSGPLHTQYGTLIWQNTCANGGHSGIPPPPPPPNPTLTGVSFEGVNMVPGRAQVPAPLNGGPAPTSGTAGHGTVPAGGGNSTPKPGPVDPTPPKPTPTPPTPPPPKPTPPTPPTPPKPTPPTPPKPTPPTPPKPTPPTPPPKPTPPKPTPPTPPPPTPPTPPAPSDTGFPVYSTTVLNGASGFQLYIGSPSATNPGAPAGATVDFGSASATDVVSVQATNGNAVQVTTVGNLNQQLNPNNPANMTSPTASTCPGETRTVFNFPTSSGDAWFYVVVDANGNNMYMFGGVKPAGNPGPVAAQGYVYRSTDPNAPPVTSPPQLATIFWSSTCANPVQTPVPPVPGAPDGTPFQTAGVPSGSAASSASSSPNITTHGNSAASRGKRWSPLAIGVASAIAAVVVIVIVVGSVMGTRAAARKRSSF